jgi:hypothetical protein
VEELKTCNQEQGWIYWGLAISLSNPFFLLGRAIAKTKIE